MVGQFKESGRFLAPPLELTRAAVLLRCVDYLTVRWRLVIRPASRVCHGER